VKESRLTKAQRGHLAKNDLPPVKFLREVPLESDGEGGDGLKVGARVLVEIFEGEKFVDIIGVKQGTRVSGSGQAASLWRRPEVAWIDVPDHRFDWIVGVSLACVQGNAHVGAYGELPGDGA